MGLWSCEVRDSQGEVLGACLLQSTAMCPFDLALFQDIEDADAFVEWCDAALGGVPHDDFRLRDARSAWKVVRHWSVCKTDGCGMRAHPSGTLCEGCWLDEAHAAARVMP